MAPSSVLRRINDQLVAPRASRGELLVAYATALAGVVLATALAADAGLSALPLVVVAVVAFDLFGGAVVNATAAAKRRPAAATRAAGRDADRQRGPARRAADPAL